MRAGLEAVVSSRLLVPREQYEEVVTERDENEGVFNMIIAPLQVAAH